MDSYWESQPYSFDINDEGAIPKTNLPITILGEVYSGLYDRDEIRSDIISKLWFTYRRGFKPIGTPSGFVSDTGWGCMHRCGQMMIAHALIMIHLGRQWRWYRNIDNPVYHRILAMFHDNRNVPYSIHMISMIGQLEGKSAGKWFGPNTVAQALKNLSVEDKWTNLVVHITMEDGVIIDEIISECHKIEENSKSGQHHPSQMDLMNPKYKSAVQAVSKEIDDNCVEIMIPPIAQTHKKDNLKTSSKTQWRPLLLIIPVRLGLNELNECYVTALKDVFQLSQCVGIIGGRPSHALWFIGQVGEDLIYLDPHEPQTVVPLKTYCQVLDDESYHCTKWSKMPIVKVDPSLAIGFVCTSEDSFITLCEQLKRKILIPAGNYPMFEIHQKRPYYFPPLYNCNISVNGTDDSAEEFELI
uniref:Cysteine protease n=1 Tax=Dugesia japonica TaxID=6161 RepID=A0A1Q0XEW5_DUGJA|nr:autophagy-related protein [Dugesia japonica]